jgi:DNA-binding NarL/FixJ family response regulator
MAVKVPCAAAIPEEPRLLTARELEVAAMVARARSNKQIAWDLGIAEQTVKNHLFHVFSKLGIEDRVTLALAFARIGNSTATEQRGLAA